jgi:hypothetical protein
MIIVLLADAAIPFAFAPVLEVSPEDPTDDAFITGIGAYFGTTPFIFLRELSQNIIAGVRFRNLTISQGTKINNATLLVRTIYTYDAGTNITVTIAGDDVDQSEAFVNSSSFTRTYTNAFVVWNISDVNGNSWHNVSVTEIVQEIVDRPGWTSGNDLSLVIFTDAGTPRREFASVDGNPAHVAILNITYAETPASGPIADQATPPYNDTDDYTWELNDTYRGFDIWEVHDENRTGYSADVNWNLLDQTLLTEIDSGAAITVQNQTWTELTALQSQQIGSLYNDTGAAAVNSYFVRFALNISAITNAIGVSDTVVTVASLSTNTPVGGGGLAQGNVGDWVGIYLYANVDDIRYLLRLAERSGAATVHAPAGTNWFTEGINQILYCEFIYRTGVVVPGNWISMSIFSDPEFDTLIHRSTYVLTVAAPPFRYPQIIASLDNGLSFLNQGDYFTFLVPPFEAVDTFISYPNGTLVTPDPLDPDENPEDVIDDLLGGPQPEDPETEVYDPLDKFQWKLMVFIVGMLMLCGSPLVGIGMRVEMATWVKIAYVMLFGIGILWALKFM